MIAKETNGPYSHSGLVFVESGEVQIWQALGPVNRVPLEKWLSMRRPQSQVQVIRSHFIELLDPEEFQKWETEALIILKKNFMNKPFDSDYLWNNFDEAGVEKLYCTEFITKFWNLFLARPIKPKPMSFSKNYEFWLKYYKGNLPEGKLGNSPNDFLRYNQFISVGFLNL